MCAIHFNLPVSVARATVLTNQRGSGPEPGDLPSVPSFSSCFDFQYVLPLASPSAADGCGENASWAAGLPEADGGRNRIIL